MDSNLVIQLRKVHDVARALDRPTIAQAIKAVEEYEWLLQNWGQVVTHTRWDGHTVYVDNVSISKGLMPCDPTSLRLGIQTAMKEV
jgi:hypothetical protein